MPLDALARAFINTYQGGVSVVGRPYSRIAETLEVDERQVLDLIRTLLDDGSLSRFGPIYDAVRLGGSQTLAALTAPEADFAKVAEQVNALPEVAHNYRREHALNMWFVVASPSVSGVAETLNEIERQTGLKVYDFPKQQEFYLGLWLRLADDGAIDTVPVPARRLAEPQPLSLLDRAVVSATQSGLPLEPEPAKAIAKRLGVATDEVVASLQGMLDTGVIRRIGAVPNHYRLGLRANGMTVWDVPDELAAELGRRVGALDFVSHAYLRPRHPGVWPYNLFAMVHGTDREQVIDKAARVGELLGDHCRRRDLLFSSEVLKKTGLQVAA